ncbi:MAG: PTS sugar transporter subunit IIA [Candidatus Binataceae bacterium]
MQLRVRDVSRLLRVPEKTVHDWIERGILRASQINDQYRLHRADLLECITSQNMDAPAGMFAGTGGNRQTISLTTSLRAGGIHYGISGADKESVLANAVARLPLSNQRDRELYLHLLLAREALGTSAIGDGIAIPHVRRPAIFRLAKPLVTLCFLERPIDFHASDARPVGVLFFLMSPTVQFHLALLSRLAFVLSDPELRAAIIRQAAPAEILAQVQRVEDALVAQSAGKEPT